LIRLYTGAEAELVDSGGTSWSATAGADPPGGAPPLLIVRVRAAADLDLDRLDKIVATAKPAHIPHRIEVVS
jgi:hypothetical protein